MQFDVLILGAGIVGSACALECARAGMKVGIVEPNVPANGASAAGMGHIVVMDDSPAQLALSRYGRELWQQMRQALPATVEYEQCGTLWVAADEEEMQEVHAKQRTYASVGVETEILDAQALEHAEPQLRKGLAGGLRVPGDGVIYPPAAARFFLDEAIRLGATLLRGVLPVAAAQGRVKLQDGSGLSAGAIVIATGVNTSLVPWITVQPRKGHLVITDRYPGFVRHQLVELGYLKSAHKLTADSVAFNVQPRQTGQLLIGSSRQYSDAVPDVDAAILRRMLDRASEYLPRISELSAIRVWTGFRAATPDKLPLIGPTPDRSVFLAMGFEGLGITNAPGAARLVGDYLLGREPAIDRTPFLPGRALKQAEAMRA
ncbi:NAD(P)/FAD-dependent oxidoreductase [Silvibacterium acidisoli]|uniref:NAD(P)/FAD-dependent oxidoreductase n=1 Tax=Acidobacteriaceae bacterium ZG23-2 TaxID=2883246 RepID=UPI00406CC5BA